MEVFSQTIILIVVIATLINSSEGKSHYVHRATENMRDK